jgi:mRNA-degrading endonuclease YafQ of YafQ-DinJ toxin-antitoxin module
MLQQCKHQKTSEQSANYTHLTALTTKPTKRSTDTGYVVQDWSTTLVKDAIDLFIDDPFNESLRNHPLKDKWISNRSISADDDLRLHYRVIDKGTALFVAVGTHDELYR